MQSFAVSGSMLADLAGEVLKLPLSAISLERPLASLGMDSLQAAELSARITERWGVECPLDWVLSADSLATLASELSGSPAPAVQRTEEPTDTFPLTSMQESFWWHQRVTPESRVYHTALCLELRDSLDLHRLERAVAAVVERHPALAMVCETGPQGRPLGRIRAPSRAQIVRSHDVPGCATLAEIARAAHEPFDLESGSLFRVDAFQSGGRSYVLLTAHHLVVDLWSLSMVLRTLVDEYDGRMPSEGHAYHEGAAFASLASCVQQVKPEDEAYWHALLDAGVPRLALPLDCQPGPKRSRAGGRRRFLIARSTHDALSRLARQENVSLYTLLLSAYAVFLSRHTGQQEMLIGSPASDRSDPRVAATVGCFVNTLALRMDLSGRPSFRQVLARARDRVRDAVRHQSYPFSALVSRAQADGDASGSPVVQTLFTLHRSNPALDVVPLLFGSSAKWVQIGDWSVAPIHLDEIETQFDLALMLAETADGLAGCWEYRQDAFEPATVDRFVERWERLLQSIVRGADRRIGELDILPPPEIQRILRSSRDGQSSRRTPCAIHTAIDEQCARRPERHAICMGDRTLTYGQLLERSEAIAQGLLKRRLSREARVAVLMPACIEAVTTAIGIWKAGGVYVPIDPGYPPKRVRDMLHDCGAAIVVRLSADVPARASDELVNSATRFVSYEELIEARGKKRLLPAVAPDQLAWVIYTSGSAGTPKGVMVTHRGAMTFGKAQRQRVNVGEDWRILQLASFSFDASLSDVLMSLPIGATLCIAPPEARIPGSALERLIAEQRVSLITASASLLSALPVREYPHLRAIISTAEACRAQFVATWAQRCRVFNGYGPTEVTIGATLAELKASSIAPRTRLPIGRPFSGYRVYVLDADLRPVPIGVSGEIFIGGAAVARGYLNQPALTAARYVPDPLCSEPGARMYRTGDLGRLLPSGEFDFLGRCDAQIKIRGFRVEPSEVAAAINRLIPGSDAVVEAYTAADSHARLVAYIACPERQRPARQALVSELRRSLPAFMVPASLVFLDDLPRTPSGKLDARALPDARSGESERSAGGIPRSAIETSLLSVWRELLRDERIGVHDNFFDAGGHSLLVGELLGKVSELFGREIAAADLFAHPTVRMLADFLARGPNSAPAIVQNNAPVETHARAAVAIVGVACRMPGAENDEELWRALEGGVESVRRFTREELLGAGVAASLVDDPAYVPARAIVEKLDEFDAAFFGFNAREAQLLHPQLRILLECAQLALDDAGYDPDRFAAGGRHIGAFVGVGASEQWAHLVAACPGLVEALGELKLALGTSSSFAATLLAYKLNLTGPCVSVDTACSSSLVAVHQACRSLLAGDCDVALAGGASVPVPVIAGHRYEIGNIASPDGCCRPFDAEARGTVRGMGAGVVVLRRLQDAVRDGDHIHAVIRGSSVNNDGARKVGFTAPSPEGQARVVSAALAGAGIEADSVEYVEAHGTATELGDQVELAGLTKVFGACAPGSIALGSVKSNLGHLDAAAGVAGLIKAILALRKQVIPPTLHFRTPNAALKCRDTPFYINVSPREWARTPKPRRAGVSSFGIGGTNAHVVLEESPERPAAGEEGGPHLILLSANTRASLDAARGRLSRAVAEQPDISLQNVAYTLACGRRSYAHRLACIAGDHQSLLDGLVSRDPQWCEGCEHEPRVLFHFHDAESAWLARVSALCDADGSFRKIVDSCAELAMRVAGLDIRQAIRAMSSAHDDDMEAPAVQVATFALELALADYFQRWGVTPDQVCGTGVGALVAAVVAGGLSMDDALRLLLEHARSIERRTFGGSEIVCPASKELVRAIETVCRIPALIDVVSASTGELFTAPQELANHWAGQLCKQTIPRASCDVLLRDPSACVVLFGSSPTPCGSDGAEERRLIAAHDAGPDITGIEQPMLEAIARLWVGGANIDPTRYYASRRTPPQRVRLPGYAFTRQRHWPDTPARSPPSELRAESPPSLVPEPAPASLIRRFCGELMGRTPDLDDDFFAEGGDSLLATKLCARINTALGTTIHPRTLFELGTIRALSDHVVQAVGAAPVPPSALRRAPATEGPRVLPLSFQQQEMWLLHKLERESGLHNLPFALRLRGRLCVASLAAAFSDLATLHPILTARFSESDGVPQQKLTGVPPALDILERAMQIDDALEWAAENGNRPFDLQTGPLIRGTLVPLAPDDHLLVVALHHIVADGWSVVLLLGSLASAYESREAGAAPLPRRDAPTYESFIEAQQTSREETDGTRMAAAEYWRKRLSGMPFISLPYDRQPGGAARDECAVEVLNITPALTHAARAVIQETRTTSFALALAVLKALIYRCAGERDIGIATVISTRSTPDLESVVGPFVGTSILRTHVHGSSTFRSLLLDVRDAVLEAQTHAETPFASVVDALNPPRRAASNPFTPICMTLQYRAEDTSLGAVRVEDVSGLPKGATKYDLMVWMEERGGEWTLSFEYRTALFERDTICRLARGYANLLSSALANIDSQVSSLTLLDSFERHWLLEGCNSTSRLLPAGGHVHQRFSEQARRSPRAIAVVADSDGSTVTYEELEQRANRLAWHLIARGVGSETPVGICLEREIDLVVAVLATLKAGGAFVPLDPSLPTARLAEMIRKAAVGIVVTRSQLSAQLPETIAVRIEIDRKQAQIASCQTAEPGIARLDGNLAYILFTSGSTGGPKGAANTHGALESRLAWMVDELDFTCEDRIAQKTPCSFDVSVWELLAPLTVGAAVILARPGGHRDPAYLSDWIARQRISITHFVPSMLATFLDHVEDTRQHAALRLIVCSGEALPATLQERVRMSWEARVALANLYGPTEAAIDVSWWLCDTPSPTPIVPIGRPIWNTRLYVLDERLDPAGICTPGEICIGGLAPARGYCGDPVLTGRQFVPDPHGKRGARMYRTGDLGRIRSDGSIEFLGRIDNQVKLRGYRIELDEIEETLRGTGLVTRAAAAVRGDSAEQQRLFAAVVPDAAVAAPILGWIKFARRNPTAVREALPLPDGTPVFASSAAEIAAAYSVVFDSAIEWACSCARDGDTVIDAGAGAGLFGLALRRYANVRLIAYEPIADAYTRLRRNLEVYAPEAKAFNLGLGERSRAARLLFDPTGAAAPREIHEEDGEEPGRTASAASWEVCDVQLSTLSDQMRILGIDRVALLRIGSSHAALQTLQGIAPEHWPAIERVLLITEVGENASLAELRRLLQEHGYEIEPRQPAQKGETRCLRGWRPEAATAAGSASVTRQRWCSPPRFKEAILQDLRRKLPSYMVPDLVLVDSLPTTHSGKLDRRALPVADVFEPVGSPALRYENALEEQLGGIVAEVLGVPDPGREGDFFLLGGNSLQAARLAHRIERELGRRVDLQLIFGNPRLAVLAAAVAKLAPSESALPQMQVDPASRFEPFPLTGVQQAYLAGRAGIFQLGSVATHGYLELDVDGLDTHRFETALNALVRRHDQLRSIVCGPDEQRVLANVPKYNVECLDLRDKTDALRDIELATVRAEMSHRVLDVSQWPLFEVRLSRLADHRYRIHLGLDAIAVDGWSIRRLAHDLNATYETLGTDRLAEDAAGASCAAEPRFRDYVLALTQLQATSRYAAARHYWTQRIDTLPRAPSLPAAREPGRFESPAFTRRRLSIGRDGWQRMLAMGRSRHLTASVLVLTAYAEVLARWSGEHHFLLNLPIHDRLALHAGVGSIVGNFTSVILCEIDLRAAGTFAERAHAIQKQLLLDLEHRYFSGLEVGRLLARKGGDPRAARAPVVFTSMLDLFAADSSPTAEGLIGFGRETFGVAQTAQASLDCVAYELHGGLEVSWDAVDAVYAPGMIDALFEAFEQRLGQLVCDDAWDATGYPPLPAAQQAARSRWIEFGDVPERLLHHPFRISAATFPDKIAITAPDEELTYRQLEERASALASHLIELGATREQPVGILMAKCVPQAVAALAVSMSGAAYLPIDAALPAARQRELLEIGEVRIVLTEAHRSLGAGVVGTRQVITVDARWEAAGLKRASGRAANCQPGDLAYVIFTSGSTGKPKGVMIEHRAALNTVLDINGRFGVQDEDSVLAVSSLSFDLSVYDLFGMWAAGGTVVLPAVHDASDPRHWLERLAACKVTVWNSVPVLASLLADAAAEQPEYGSLDCVRLALLSGDWIPLALPARLREGRPAMRIVSLGGATEASIWSIFHPIERVDPGWRSVPYGRPLLNQTVDVLDANLQPCPDWVPGEIYIGGEGLARGYWRAGALTGERFIDRGGAGGRLYRTGDRGRFMPDGEIEFLGRTDTQVKVNGNRIELGEVEHGVEAHPAIAQAAVIADPPGRDSNRLIAFVKLADAAADEGAAAGILQHRHCDRDSADALWRAVSTAGQAAADDAATDIPVSTAELGQLIDSMTATYHASIRHVFVQSGVFARKGERRSLEDIHAATRIQTRYTRWLVRALGEMEKLGFVGRGTDAFECVVPVNEPDAPSAVEAWLPKVLTGDIHSAERYIDESTVRNYQEFFRKGHHVAKAAVAACVASATGPLSVLEVGAGYGSLTQHLLPLLPTHSTYHFTDVSPFFLNEASDRLRDFPFVTYGALDIDTDPHLQGFTRHAHQLVVAASVLHVCRDVGRTLKYLRSLLAPGGLLLLIEETRFFPFFDLGMGLQQGFDSFRDAPLRTMHPLLTRAQWSAALEAEGFLGSAVFCKGGSASDTLGFDVIMARAPLAVADIDPAALTAFLRKRLPAPLLPSRYVLLDELPLNVNGKVDRSALSPPRRAHSAAETGKVPPRNETERALARLWQQVLKMESIGIQEDFFAIGGDSLSAARLATLARKAFCVDLPIAAIFEAPTIEQQAILMLTAQSAAALASAGDRELEHMTSGEI